MDIDILIVGGGIAGMWALDHLRQQGYRAYLVENRALGSGQTIAAQGIIHGGLKYSLKGVLTASANEIREMPLIWRECLSGQREPNLSKAIVRSHCCYLWQTDTLASQAGMWGAQLNLRVRPELIEGAKRPELLGACPGTVYQLNEQVLSPNSILQCLKERNKEALLLCNEERGLKFSCSHQNSILSVDVRCQGEELHLVPEAVVFTAGSGNQQLGDSSGIKNSMQKRPLHMVMVKGDLPYFQGHCVDGAKTRVTITSERLSTGEVVWQLGGQIAEQGVSVSSEELVQRAAQELRAVLPGFQTQNLEFATYRVDRAEKKSALGIRPETPQVLRNKNVITCWPTKLAFAPRSAEMIHQIVSKQMRLVPTTVPKETEELLQDWPVPDVAKSPWEEAEQWFKDSGTEFTDSITPLDHAA